jgi:hypothetical protein
MAKLASEIVLAAMDLPFPNYTSANSGADRQEHKRTGPASGAELIFAEGPAIAVVIHTAGQAQVFLDPFGQGKIFPAGSVNRTDSLGGIINGPSKTDSTAFHVGFSFPKQSLTPITDLPQHPFAAASAHRITFKKMQGPPSEVKQSGTALRSADVYSNDVGHKAPFSILWAAA